MIVTLYPTAGRLVRDPATLKPLPPEGADVTWNVHWARREADGDVSRIAPAPAPVAAPAPAVAAVPAADPEPALKPTPKKARK